MANDQDEATIGSVSKPQAEAFLAQPVQIPRNPIALTARFIFVIFIFDFGFSVLLSLFSGIGSANGGLFSLIAILAIIKLVVIIFLLLRLTAKWADQTYLISETELIHRQGIASVREDIYEINNLRHVTLRQDFLGRMLHYGHLDLTFATGGLKEELELRDLKDPEHYKRVFEQNIG